jgi:hypothetical protein
MRLSGTPEENFEADKYVRINPAAFKELSITYNGTARQFCREPIPSS